MAKSAALKELEALCLPGYEGLRPLQSRSVCSKVQATLPFLTPSHAFFSFRAEVAYLEGRFAQKVWVLPNSQRAQARKPRWAPTEMEPLAR